MWFRSLVQRFAATTIIMDTGKRVRMGPMLAEGGFSFVFEGTDEGTGAKYALKRIRCMDAETLQSCRREAGVHRAIRHTNVMALLGMVVAEQNTVCYMLFPFYPRSLRSEVNRRTFDVPEITSTPPWTEVTALQLIYGCLMGLNALHTAGFSHRDLKLENILLRDPQTPVLMDFGSTGPLKEMIETRQQVLMLVEQASMHTTLPYRPPELFEGGVMRGDPPIDFAKVDIWSMGCTIFALLFGASPFESEFARSDGRLRVVECTQLKVINGPQWPPADTLPTNWYSSGICSLVENMLCADRAKRPTLSTVIEQVQAMIRSQGGTVKQPEDAEASDDDFDTSGIALMGSNYV